MTNARRLETLKRLRMEMRQRSFRESIQVRRDCLAQIVPLLNFNDVYYENALPTADVLGRPGFSTNMYEHTLAQMDSLVGQAITELEYGLTPRPEAGNFNQDRPAITISNSTIGILNTGHVGMIDSIEVHVQSLSAAGHSDAAVALKSLAEATATSAELSQQARIEALEQLDELARQAAVAPEHRSKVGVLSALFHGLATTLSAAGGTAEVWSTWGNVIKKFLGL